MRKCVGDGLPTCSCHSTGASKEVALLGFFALLVSVVSLTSLQVLARLNNQLRKFPASLLSAVLQFAASVKKWEDLISASGGTV